MKKFILTEKQAIELHKFISNSSVSGSTAIHTASRCMLILEHLPVWEGTEEKAPIVPKPPINKREIDKIKK